MDFLPGSVPREAVRFLPAAAKREESGSFRFKNPPTVTGSKNKTREGGLSFRPEQRLRDERMFKFVFDHGEFSKGKISQAWVFKDREKKIPGRGPKLGAVVGKKTHLRANVRNLWKRRMREAFRLEQKRILPETVLLWQARQAAEVPSLEMFRKELEALLGKTGSIG